MKELCFVFLFQQYFFQYYVAKQLSVILKNDALRTFFFHMYSRYSLHRKKRTTCVKGMPMVLGPNRLFQ